MSTPYTIQFGDTLVLIAKRHGFASWREIYNHPDNAAFRRKRPNPDKIYPGDILMIPDRGGDPTTPPPQGRDNEYVGFTAAERQLVRDAIQRGRTLMRTAILRMNLGRVFHPMVNLDAKLKIFNVFKINLFTISDFAFPENFPRLPGVRGFPPTPANPAIDQFHFRRLKHNFTKIRDGLNDPFRKIRHRPGEEPRCGMFGAFVVPGDSTMHFCPSFFDDELHPGDKRALTIMHERAHTLLPEPDHPGTENNGHIGVVPHLGKPDMRVGQALQNPNCYEWLTQSLQRDYNPCDHIGPEHGIPACGTGQVVGSGSE